MKIGIRNDDILELDESFFVRVDRTKGPDAVRMVSGLTEVTILDNDFVTLGLESTSYVAEEGSGSVRVCVNLRGQMEGNISVIAVLSPSDDGSAQGLCEITTESLTWVAMVPNLATLSHVHALIYSLSWKQSFKTLVVYFYLRRKRL